MPPSHRTNDPGPRRRIVAACSCTLVAAVALGSSAAIDRSAASGLADTGAVTSPMVSAALSPVAAAELGAWMDRWCVACHAEPDAAYGLDVEPFTVRLLEAGDPDAALEFDADDVALLRMLRPRLDDRSMPPTRRRPSDEQYARGMELIDLLLASANDGAGDESVDEVRPAPVRRLTRAEYVRSVRDLFGVSIDPHDLPPDEIGHGFDTNAGALTMPPLRIEQYVDMAERIATAAVVDVSTPRTTVRHPGHTLELTPGKGRANGDEMLIWSNGEAGVDVDVPRAGRYRLVAEVRGQQAGSNPVRMELRAGADDVRRRQVTEHMTPTRIEAEFDLLPGTVRVAAAFINDYHNPGAADPNQRDRNAFVRWLELEGPLDDAVPSPLQAELAARFGDRPADEAWPAAVVELATRAWRRPLDARQADDLVAAVRSAVAIDGESADGPVAGPDADGARVAVHRLGHEHLRVAITAILVHPRFLYLPAETAATRPDHDAVTATADAWTTAARLAAVIWSSVPDPALAERVAAGGLDTAAGRREVVGSMIDDPRSIALAERFAVQWLQIGAIEDRAPDPERFPGVDDALRDRMRLETVLFLDDMLRARRPLWDLLDATDTFLDATLAEHYGIDGVDGSDMRRVQLASGEPLGVLRHGSVLLTTSNPTRTSPVKRGKWVLEALLDDPPPPAPADIPALPNDGEPHDDLSLRDLLERHREDPSCAGCHRRMDPLGFALESFDAVGRGRTEADGRPVDVAAELPDGTTFSGPSGLRDLLLGVRRDDVARSTVRHLAIFALGRGLDPADDSWIEPIVADLMEGDAPTLERIVLGIIESPALRPTDGPARPAIAPSPGDRR